MALSWLLRLGLEDACALQAGPFCFAIEKQAPGRAGLRVSDPETGTSLRALEKQHTGGNFDPTKN